MSKFIRALFVSAVATGVVVAVGSLFSGSRMPRLNTGAGGAPGEVDADELGPDQTDRLLRELDADL